MTDATEVEESEQKLVWIKSEDPDPDVLERIHQSIDLPDGYKAIITSDELGIIEAHEMRDELEEMLDV